MTAALADRAPREAVEDAQLVLTELMTNALKHGAPDAQDQLEVGWCLLERHLRVCVEDAGTSLAIAMSDAGPSSESGRGLAIVDALCETWRLDLEEGSTKVVADIAIV